jgi:hypothetical protein
MLPWVAIGLLFAAIVIGAWCLISAMWPSVGHSSVNDPTPSETRITCWAALLLMAAAVACITVELVRA